MFVEDLLSASLANSTYTYGWLIDVLQKNDEEFRRRSNGTSVNKVYVKISKYYYAVYEKNV